MAWVHLLGRKFAAVLTDPDFELLSDWPYWNRFQRQGHSYYGYCRRRRFCVSQSKREGPDEIENLARVFRNGDSIDTRIGPFYSNSKGQVGLLVAAWNGSQWLQMISPGTPDQPKDIFFRTCRKIRTDRTFDPQALRLGTAAGSTSRQLQELEDIIGCLQGRRDFDW